MSEANNNDKFLSASAIAGGSVPLVIAADAVMHGGVVGGIVGLGISGLVWLLADEMGKKGWGVTPPAPSLPSKCVRRPGEHGFLYRAFNGKDEREEDEQEGDTANDDYVQLGAKLFIHIDDLLSNRIAILGMPGQGKSNTVAKLCEEIAPFETPLVIYDSKPEYTQLCQEPYFVHPAQMNASNLSPERAKEFGLFLMQDRLQVVVDLTSYEDDDAAATVMIGVNAGIRAYAMALSNEDRIPVLVVLDEAHIWLPQSGTQSVVSKEKDESGKSLFTRLQNSFIWMTNTGRSFGIGSIVSTQRPANIDKRIIAPSEWKLLLKATMPNDLAVYSELGLGKESARKLEVGQAHIVGPGEFADGAIYQIGKRKSPDAAKTPGLANLKKAPKMAPQIEANDDDEFDDLPVSRVSRNGNGKQAVNAPVYTVVNDATSRLDSTEETEEEPFTDDLGNDAYSQKSTDMDTLDDGNAFICKQIQRMIDLGWSHRDIAKVVGLDGRKYGRYRELCQLMDLDTNERG